MDHLAMEQVELSHMAIFFFFSPLKNKEWAILKCIEHTKGFQSFRSLLVQEERLILETVC